MSTEITRHKILVPAETSRLSELRESLSQICDEYGIPAKITRRMVLAIDEALANVIEHGNVPDPRIEVVLESDDERIIAEISDSGVPFDPSPGGNEPVQKSYPRRGFGLYLIHMIVDSVEYARTPDGRNVLKLIKNLTPVACVES